jgi:hypothetical protein
MRPNQNRILFCATSCIDSRTNTTLRRAQLEFLHFAGHPCIRIHHSSFDDYLSVFIICHVVSAEAGLTANCMTIGAKANSLFRLGVWSISDAVVPISIDHDA